MGDLTGPTAASVIIVTHQSGRHLAELFRSLGADDAGASEVIVVDNGSTDDSVALAEAAGARVIPLSDNRGFATACHAGVDAAAHDTLVFLNPDTVVSPGWLLPVLAALDEEGVGAASPTIELADTPGRYNTSGGGMTFYGLAWASDLGEPITAGADLIATPFPSGAAMAIRRDTWEQLGGFRRDFFLYYEDADLGWRMQQQGLRSVRTAAATVAHDYDFGRNPNKLFLLERNRLLAMHANYRRGTRLLLGPALWAAGTGITIVALRDGWLLSRLRAMVAAWRARRRNRSQYEANQRHRTVGDAAFIERASTGLTAMGQQRVPAGSGIAATAFGLWLRVVLPLIRRADARRGLA